MAECDGWAKITDPGRVSRARPRGERPSLPSFWSDPWRIAETAKEKMETAKRGKEEKREGSGL